MAAYELTDETWALVADLFDPPVRRGPRATVPRRQVVEAIEVAGPHRRTVA